MPVPGGEREHTGFFHIPVENSVVVGYHDNGDRLIVRSGQVQLAGYGCRDDNGGRARTRGIEVVEPSSGGRYAFLIL